MTFMCEPSYPATVGSAYWMGYQVWGRSLSVMLKMSCFK